MSPFIIPLIVITSMVTSNRLPYGFVNTINNESLVAYDWIWQNGLLDDRLDDSGNFNLSENAANIISSILTG